MYAVIKTGGKQYKVAAGNLIAVEKLAGDAGEAVKFDAVLLVGDDKAPHIGSPLVAGASVAGEIVEHRRGDKILVFKKRRRQNSKRTRGHRQAETLVRITEILTDGKKSATQIKKAPADDTAPALQATDATPAPAEAAAAVDAPAPQDASTETAGAADEGKKAKPAGKPRAKAADKDE